MDAKSKRYLQILLAVAVGWFLSYLFHISTLSFVDIRKYNLFAAPNNNGSPPQPLMKEDGEFMEMMEQRMRERINTMNSACNSKRKEICKLPEMTVPSSLYNRNFNYTICRIPKVASTNWLRAVTVMDNIFSMEDFHNNRIQGHDVTTLTVKKRGMKTITDIKKRVRISKEFLNIITVRHPFLRVVSAFHDKMSPDLKSYTFRPLSRKIEVAFRPMRLDPVHKNLPLAGAANFEDFVNFLTNNSNFEGNNDPHWQSFDSHCQPCLHKYDAIVKMESIEEDMRFLRKKLKIPEQYEEVFLGLSRRTGSKTGFAHNEATLFRQLPQQLVEKLYRKYEQDFQMFGYSWPDWLPCRR